MNLILLESLIILLLVIANGVFSMSEMAIVTARRTRLLERAERGDARARAALDLANNPDRFLSTVQIGITLIGVLAGAFAGASIAEQLAAVVGAVDRLAPYAEAISVGIVVIVVTFLSLVLGELVPKRIALNAPERVAMVVARPMRWLSNAVSPLVAALSAITNGITRVLRMRASSEPEVTEEEIKLLVGQATSTGVLAPQERELLDSVFRFGDQRVVELMTQRRDIVWIDAATGIDAAVRTIGATGYARYLLGDGSVDNLLGVVTARDVLMERLTRSEPSLRDVVTPVLSIPETAPAVGALDQIKAAGVELAAVVDEYGATVGLVTSRDLLDSITGQAVASGRRGNPEVVRREDGTWLVDAALPIAEFKRRFGLRHVAEEHEFQTVAGLIIHELGRIPAAADVVHWNGFRFEVVDMDGLRVDTVLVGEERLKDEG